MAPLDYFVIALYLVAVTAIGAASGRGQHSGLAYFLGNRSVHWLPAGITMIAASVSTITFIGMPGQAYKSDWTFLQIYMMVPIAAIIACRVFLPRYTRMGVLTAYEYLEKRFDLRTRLFASAMFLLIVGGSTGVAIYAPAIMLAEMTGVPVLKSILITGALTTGYTMFGGIKGVIYTDILQAAVFMGGWLAAMLFILHALPGGAAHAWTAAMAERKLRLLDFAADPRIPATFWAGLIGMLFTHVALIAVNQSQVQKYLAVSNLRGGQRALLFHGFGLLAVYVAFFALGTLLFLFYRRPSSGLPANIAPDRVFPFFIVHELPAGLRGLLIAGAFAAAMSTISSSLNSLANVTVVDFWDRFRPGHTVMRAKILTIAWGVVAIVAGLLAWRLGSILELIVKVNSYFYGCVLGVFLLGMCSRTATARGACVGTAAGIAAVLACSLWQPDLWVWFGAIGCLVCLFTGYLSGNGTFDALRYRFAQRARN